LAADGPINTQGRTTHDGAEYRGDGYVQSAEQCPFCGRHVSWDEVRHRGAQAEQGGLPLYILSRFIRHRSVFSTLHYVGGINAMIYAWVQRKQSGSRDNPEPHTSD
jgi:hypothetical protein